MNRGISDKNVSRLKYFIPLCVAVATLTASTGTRARDVTLGGGVGVGYEFSDRQYDDDASSEQEQLDGDQPITDNQDEQYSRVRFAPLVTLTSTAARDEIFLRYSPSFRYDLENSDNNVDHDFLATYNRFITESWQVKLFEKYLLTDYVSSRQTVETEDTAAVQADTVTETELSDDDNRRKYWVNDVSLRSDYVYWADSLFAVGYSNRILENIDNGSNSNYEDYVRHEVFSEVIHRFSSIWQVSVSGSFVRGLFDEEALEQNAANPELTDIEKDLNEYRAATAIQANLIDHQSQMLFYRFYGDDYDAEQRNNSTIHDMTLGWQWDISKELMFSLGAGPSYSKIEGSEGEWGYNGFMAGWLAFERGIINLSANRGYERRNFTGTNDNGLREFWETKLTINYQLLQYLSASLYSSYRDEDEEVILVVTPVAPDPEITTATDFDTETVTFNRKRFSTGASLGYIFWQWYTATISYDFIHQDSEKVDDSFDEHRVFVTLSYETDFFSW